MKTLGLLLVILLNCCALQAQKVVEPDTRLHPEWSKPFAPFRIAGNLYYVGTTDLACYLIATPKGCILINTGLASSAKLIKANVQSLGFKITDIKILLTTQAHFDHLGGMAEIKKLSGAKMMADYADVPVIQDGGRSDYELDSKVAVFQPIKVDRVLHNKEVISLGGMQLALLHHPGHTKGSCSYLFSVKDQKRSYKVLIANMPTIVTDKKFSAVSSYPHIAQDYAYTLKSMKKLKFDLWMASHGVQFELVEKHKPGSPYNPSAFADKKNYYQQLDDLQAEFDKKLAQK